MPEASRSRHEIWFPSQGATKGVILLTHGLNGNPASMDSLAQKLSEKNFEVLRPAFSGHRGNNEEFFQVTTAQWEKDARHFYSLAWARAQKLMVPLHHCAYSMSGLIFQALRDDLKFDRRVYFAPALSLKGWYPLAMMIAHALPWVKFRSRIPEGYYANQRSGLQPSVALHGFWEKWSQSTDLTPTLLWCDPQDELIRSSGLKALAEHPWKFAEVSTDGCTLSRRYHHLIIDEASLGKMEWGRVCEETARFLQTGPFAC